MWYSNVPAAPEGGVKKENRKVLLSGLRAMEHEGGEGLTDEAVAAACRDGEPITQVGVQSDWFLLDPCLPLSSFVQLCGLQCWSLHTCRPHVTWELLTLSGLNL